MKPFIHTFLVDNEAYFYDVNKNQVVRISNDSFNILENMKSDNETLNEELLQLQKEGYLSENRPKNIEHPVTQSLDSLLSRKLSLLTIQLTQNCNLRCSYCPYTSNDGSNRVHANKSIPIEIAEKAILFLRDHSIDSDYVAIGFYGGEPLLEEKKLKELVKFSNSVFAGRRIRYTMTTNGTLLKYNILEFLEKNNFDLMFSMDGPKEINDINRKYAESTNSVFNNVIEKINLVYKEFPKLFKSTSINMVIDPKYGLDKYEKLFEESEALKRIKVSVSILDDSYKNTKNIFSKEFISQNTSRKKDYMDYLFKNINPKKPFINMSFYEALFIPYVQKSTNGLYSYDSLGDVSCPSGQCIPGCTRLMVDVNGNFYPCERVSEECEFNIIGNVDEGIVKEKSNYILNIGRNGNNDCSQCFAISHCDMCVKFYEKKLLSKDSNMISECTNVKSSFHNYLVDYIKFKKDYMEAGNGK